jgi:hypothetical protein
MAEKKKAKKKPPAKKPPIKKPPPAKPHYVGTGGAAKAGSAILARRKRNCLLDDGKWVDGKCVR